MFKRIGMLVGIFICGCLLIEWVPIIHPFVLSELFISFVMNPLKFFATSLVLITVVVWISQFFRELIHHTSKLERKKSYRYLVWDYVGLIIILVLLLRMGWEQTAIIFSLGLFYGMISVKI